MADGNSTVEVKASALSLDGITSVIGEGFSLVRSIFDYIGDKNATEYLKQATQLQMDLDTELRKPVAEQDDQKVVAFYDNLSILTKAASDMVIALKSRRDTPA